MKWIGLPAVVVLLYVWPLIGAFHVGGLRLAPREADLLLFALLVPLSVATAGAWILDEIIIPAGTPSDPVILLARWRRAARVVVTLCLLFIAEASAQNAWQAWTIANAPPRVFTAFWMPLVYRAAGGSLVALGLAATSVYVFRPRRHAPGLCPACKYDRTGLAAGAVCPECGLGASAATSQLVEPASHA